MATTRSYQEACGMARALDVVGERWALVVVRELLLGPQRFTDLRRSLPAASSNILADRLRELEGREVLSRRRLAPPAGSVVYELTPLGRDLEPVVVALAAWGLRFPSPVEPLPPTAASVLLLLREAVRPAQDEVATYRVDLDGRAWVVRVHDGRVQVTDGLATVEDGRLTTDPATLERLLSGAATLETAVENGHAEVAGDRERLGRLLSLAVPSGAAGHG